jgi:N-methylhydantoinase A
VRERAKVPTAQIAAIFEEKIGNKLGLNALDVAQAIVRIANDKMAGAIRMVSLARGHDPRDFALFPFGGAGPLHACAIARELDIPTLLIPARPGITNALGCALANLRHDLVRGLNTPLNALDMALLHDTFAKQIAEGKAAIARDGVRVERIETTHALDMQFAGQSHVLRVPIADVALSRESLAALFDGAYWQRFHVRLPEMRAVVVNVHTAVLGVRAAWDLRLLASHRSANGATAQTRSREVFFDGAMRETPIFAREQIAAAQMLRGPCIIEQMDCTTVIEPGWGAQHDAVGNLLVQIVT